MKYDVGTAHDFEDGQCTIVTVANREVGIFKLDGEYFAVLNLCPHRHAPICQGFVDGTYLPSEPGELVFGLEDRVLRCPWHFWEYDITSGEPLFGIDRRKLRTYDVEERDGKVFVEM